MLGKDFVFARLALHRFRLGFALIAVSALILSLIVGVLPNEHLVDSLWRPLLVLGATVAVFTYIILRAPELRHMIEAFGLAACAMGVLPFVELGGLPVIESTLGLTDPSDLFIVGLLVWALLRLPVINTVVRLPMRMGPVERAVAASPEAILRHLIPDPTRPGDYWERNVHRIDRQDGPAPGVERVGLSRIEGRWETLSTVDIWRAEDGSAVVMREERMDEFGHVMTIETAILLEPADRDGLTRFRVAQSADSVPLSFWIDAKLSDLSGDYWDSMLTRITGAEDRTQHNALAMAAA